MHSIHLICTTHAENGMCSSSELLKLFKQIEPEVIFEELPPSFYEKFYIAKRQSNLETSAIIMYLKSAQFRHVPVDFEDIPSETFFQNYKKLISKVEGSLNRNGFDFRNLIDQKRNYTYSYGFSFINSDDCMRINDGIYGAIQNEVQELNDENFKEIFNCWNDVNEKRENVMLQNIYDFSKRYEYKKAIFMIGHAHRKSIISKIKDCNESQEIKLNWIY
ncbi:hypothetical protein [Flavobacterium aquicola]|uniref:TraB family protein n=1 Tax=Flavobacterium aquicola TaxID=1682742 RepID=A0A3E0EPL8_9FLAO|nr:hypothetical protein [Flavobacterium aquicola]REH00046.1 hypothetical protein C8P67_10312 [Flavobacterium aquicola]